MSGFLGATLPTCPLSARSGHAEIVERALLTQAVIGYAETPQRNSVSALLSFFVQST